MLFAGRWSLEQVQDNSVSRHAKQDVRSAPPLDDPEMIRTGGHHQMTGMPAFGPTHDEKELWAMVAFVRQLLNMSPSEYDDLVAASAEDKENHHGANGMHDEHEKSDAQ